METALFHLGDTNSLSTNGGKKKRASAVVPVGEGSNSNINGFKNNPIGDDLSFEGPTFPFQKNLILLMPVALLKSVQLWGRVTPVANCGHYCLLCHYLNHNHCQSLRQTLEGCWTPACKINIGMTCSKPFGPKPEIQHDKKRKRSVPTLTREEWLSREGNSNSMKIPKRKLWA
jgi:hypothetical protein